MRWRRNLTVVAAACLSLLLGWAGLAAYRAMDAREAARDAPTVSSVLAAMQGDADAPPGVEVTPPPGWSMLGSGRTDPYQPRDRLDVPSGPGREPLRLLGRHGSEHDRIAVLRQRAPVLPGAGAERPAIAVPGAMADIGAGCLPVSLIPGSERQVRLAGRPAWQFDFTCARPDGTRLRGRDLTLVRAAAAYDLRLVATPRSFGSAARSLGAVAASWRWTPGAAP